MSGSEENTVQWRPDARELAQRLKPVMDQVEAGRLHALRRRSKALLIIVVCVILGILGAIGVSSHGGQTGAEGFFVLILSVVIAVTVYYFMASQPLKSYRHHFKSTVFRHAVRAVAPGVEYLPSNMISRHLFEQSGLFSSDIDSYEGEDCFHGKVGSTQISLSELHVQRKERSGKNTRWVTVFQGIFMIADFHKNFRCTVIVEPDFAEAAFGFLGRKLQGLSGNLIRLENPEFERAFKVRGSDPVEARYLLTPDMQERFLALRNNWSPQVRAAFRDSSLVLAIPKSGDWFEVDPSTPANSPGHLTQFFNQLLPLLYIPTQMDLNTRLWTKD